jgi:hypothetical protein
MDQWLTVVYSNENLGKKTENRRLADTVLAVQNGMYSVHIAP